MPKAKPAENAPLPLTLEERESNIRAQLADVTAEIGAKEIDQAELSLEALSAAPEELAFRTQEKNRVDVEVGNLQAKQRGLKQALEGIVFKKADAAWRRRCAFAESQEAKALDCANKLLLAVPELEDTLKVYVRQYLEVDKAFGDLLRLAGVVPALMNYYPTNPEAAVSRLLCAYSPIDHGSHPGEHKSPPGAMKGTFEPSARPYSEEIAEIKAHLHASFEKTAAQRAAENPRKFKATTKKD